MQNVEKNKDMAAVIKNISELDRMASSLKSDHGTMRSEPYLSAEAVDVYRVGPVVRVAVGVGFEKQAWQHVSLSTLWESGKVVVELVVQGGIGRHGATVDLRPRGFCMRRGAGGCIDAGEDTATREAISV